MNNDATPQLISSFIDLLDEAYKGPSDPKTTWFTDNAPQAALLGTLASLDAEQASQLQPSGQSIASHTEHLRWSLVLAQAYFRGEQPKVDWEESWRVQTVTEEQWQTLQNNLKREYEAVRVAIESVSDWANPFFVTGTLALLPHAAYHLGAIRQMVHFVTAKEEQA